MLEKTVANLVTKFAKLFWDMVGDTNSQVFHTLVVFLIVTVGVYKLVKWTNIGRKLPPGPRGLPIWGYLAFIKNAMHLQFNELAQKFGSIFSVYLGSNLTVVLCDYRVIRDAFRREEFTGRPKTAFMSILEGYGVINTEGALWKEQRKFLHEKLRSFGMKYTGNGKEIMNKRIIHEVRVLLEGLTRQQGAPTNISSSLAVSISNVICSLTMSVRFYHGDLKFKRFMDLIDEGFRLFANLSSANFIPWLRWLKFPWIHRTQRKISQNRAEMAEFFQAIINEHRVTFDKDNIRDIVDTYLYEIQKAQEENREHELFQGKNQDRHMQQILGDLFSAGMETVKSTLEWAVVFMLHHPEAAQAVQNELDFVVGRSRLPSLNDLPNLPITDATIQEILRRSNLVPLGTPHATTRNVELNGYTLPAGTHVIPLLYAVHMDPELWGDPEAFRPSRFIAENGTVSKPEYFMPFGVGRRMCLGDTLARMELFLFFSSLLHKFNLTLPEGASLPNLNGTVGVTISPEPFKVCLLERDLDLADCNNETTNGPLRKIGSH